MYFCEQLFSLVDERNANHICFVVLLNGASLNAKNTHFHMGNNIGHGGTSWLPVSTSDRW